MESKQILGIVKKHILFFVAIPIVIWSQVVLLEPHLKFGFSDVDWGFLGYYKQIKASFPDPFDNLKITFERWGVYTHQSYYIGFQSEFFGLNFISYQITTHIFKIIATLLTYFIFYSLSGNLLASFFASLFYNFAYPSYGTLYTVVTSSDYTGVITLSLFVWLYVLILKNPGFNIYKLILCKLLLISTLFLSTERMYPILFLIFIIELYKLTHSKDYSTFMNNLKRGIFIFLFPTIGFLLSPGVFLDFITRNGRELTIRIFQIGDWQVLLTPFISLGSLFIPHNYWKYFGLVDTTTLSNYINYFVMGPLFLFTIFLILTASMIFPRTKEFIIETLILSILLGLVIYIISINHKTHFDPSFVTPALVGAFLLAYSLSAFNQWRIYKEQLMLCMSLGVIFAFLYILLTWVAADNNLIFSGVHRYLTIPSMGSTIFVVCILTLIYRRLTKIRYLKRVAILIFIVYIPLMVVGNYQIQDFFDHQLKHGFGAQDKEQMRNQFRNYIQNLSSERPSLFYFDFSEDNNNGYYYDNTLLGGFQAWMLFEKPIYLREKLRPEAFWNNIEKLGSLIGKKEEQVGFYMHKGDERHERFYPLKNFYAFKLKDKKVIDIKDEIIEQFDLN